MEGLSFDFICLNLVGFSCYSAYNVAYYFNNDIRADYAAAHDGSLPAVQLNDVFFALHAVAGVYRSGSDRMRARACVCVYVCVCGGGHGTRAAH